jgi:hypothetical protein
VSLHSFHGASLSGDRLTRLLSVGLLILGLSLSFTGPAPAKAEGTEQFNTAQALASSTVLYADILTAGETINISVCTDTNISIWNTNGTPAIIGDDTALVTSAAFTANLTCGSALPNPITNPYKYTPASIGTYRIQLSSSQARYDISVTANSSTNPNPTLAGGRVWSYRWDLNTGAFTLASATDVDMYVLVPASQSGQSFVYKLDLNRFAGNAYSLAANSLGLDAPYSGISATQASSTVTPEFPIYLGFPGKAGSANTSTPTVTNARFLDDANGDNIFSPNGTVGVQDTGNFKFDTNISNGNYAITIDTNQDGVYGTGDRLLLGKASLGSNSVNWDGKYPNGSPVGVGVYHAQITVRTGEYHFIASDVETSGGTTDSGVTWGNGLTIYRAINASTNQNTTVYWDDLTELSGSSDATANVPTGVTSGSLADANHDGKADGFHTWGTFTSNSVGNNNNIDTYVYGPSATATATIAVALDEQGDTDGVASSAELGANNLGDGNGDGTEDYLQNNVSSLPNPIANGYNTLAVSGGTCNGLTNVSVKAESELSTPDTHYDYPVGLSDFHITCLTPGATTNVKIYYDKVYNTSAWTARKFIGGAYANIPGAVFATQSVGGTPVTTLSYTVTDGGALDADGLVNGVIIDPVGPGIATASTTTVGAPNTGIKPQDGFTPLALGLGGLLLIVGTLYARRRHG